jgi:hypothetical protein
MDFLTVAVSSDDHPGQILQCHGMLLEGTLCLVAKWLESPDGEDKKPTLLLRLTEWPHQKSSGQMGDYIVNSPLPKGVLGGHIPAQLAGKIEAVHLPMEDDPGTSH